MTDRARRGRASRVGDPIWQGGFLVGAALGAAATVLGRRAERSARRGLVDWPAATSFAIGRLRRAPGSLPPAEVAASGPIYRAAVEHIAPRLAAALGTDMPGIVDRVDAVSRAEWVRANAAVFADLVGRLEGRLLDQVVPRGGGLGHASIALVNRFVTTRQLGFVLGFMGQRVLGQYDVALLSAEAAPGRLLFVDENIRQIARTLDVPLDPFRVWIAIHETTHAFEFEAHPWLRPYLAERLEAQLADFGDGLAVVSRDTVRQLGRALRGEARPDGRADHWLERFMTDDQRRRFRETQAVMSLLEGFSDYVMDEVGRDVVPDVARISARFHARREHKTGFEKAVGRLIGMDLKLEQYRAGEHFVREIAAIGGRVALARLWDGPTTLPRDGEIDDPAAWVRRVVGSQSPS